MYDALAKCVQLEREGIEQELQAHGHGKHISPSLARKASRSNNEDGSCLQGYTKNVLNRQRHLFKDLYHVTDSEIEQGIQDVVTGMGSDILIKAAAVHLNHNIIVLNESYDFARLYTPYLPSSCTKSAKSCLKLYSQSSEFEQIEQWASTNTHIIALNELTVRCSATKTGGDTLVLPAVDL